MSENMPNVDPETGISYGVIAVNNLADWVLEQIQACGSDLDYEDAQDEIGQAISNAIDYKNLTKHQQDEADSVINDLIEIAMYNYENHGDNVRYRYETEHEGKPLIVQTTSGGEMFVFVSPVTQVVRQCSPCCPNAGDLDSPCDKDANFIQPSFVKVTKRVPYGMSVKAYALPDNWLRDNKSEGAE